MMRLKRKSVRSCRAKNHVSAFCCFVIGEQKSAWMVRKIIIYFLCECVCTETGGILVKDVWGEESIECQKFYKTSFLLL